MRLRGAGLVFPLPLVVVGRTARRDGLGSRFGLHDAAVTAQVGSCGLELPCPMRLAGIAPPRSAERQELVGGVAMLIIVLTLGGCGALEGKTDIQDPLEVVQQAAEMLSIENGGACACTTVYPWRT